MMKMKKIVLAFMVVAVVFLGIPGVTAGPGPAYAMVSTTVIQPESFVIVSPGVLVPISPYIVNPFLKDYSPVIGITVPTVIPDSAFPVLATPLLGSYYEGTIEPVTSTTTSTSTVPSTWDDWFKLPTPSSCPLAV